MRLAACPVRGRRLPARRWRSRPRPVAVALAGTLAAGALAAGALAFGIAAFGPALLPRAAADEAPPPCDGRPWVASIAAFEADDARRPAPPGAIVFVGSSSIRLWNLPASFPGLPVLNRGFGGSQLCDTVHFFDVLVARHRPAHVVVYAGDNDLAAGKSPEAVRADFAALTERMRQTLPDAGLIYIAIKPSVARRALAPRMREANRLIAEHCARRPGCRFLDVWPAMLDERGEPRRELLADDGLHLSASGYALWTRQLLPLLAGTP